MADYIYLELDRKAPNFEIYSPNYTTKDIYNTIRIEADEKISNNHTIYGVDKNGVEYNYTFELENENELVGIICFHNIPLGIFTLYVSIKDEVENHSPIKSATINVIDSYKLATLNISDYEHNKAQIDEHEKLIVDEENSNMKDVKIYDKNYNIITDERNYIDVVEKFKNRKSGDDIE